MKYHAICESSQRYPIRLMCRALAVAAGGYYEWRSRPESARSVSARTMLSSIRASRATSSPSWRECQPIASAGPRDAR